MCFLCKISFTFPKETISPPLAGDTAPLRIPVIHPAGPWSKTYEYGWINISDTGQGLRMQPKIDPVFSPYATTYCKVSDLEQISLSVNFFNSKIYITMVCTSKRCFENRRQCILSIQHSGHRI